jgi:hypothetical protein
MAAHTPFSFGIGCYHFSLSDSYGREFSFSNYLERVQAALEGISNVSNVVVEKGPLFQDSEHELNGERTDLRHSPGAFPPNQTYKLSYDLYIPERLQKQLFEPFGDDLPGSESFKVMVYPNYTGIPISFVTAINSRPERRPSACVALIRKFLEGEIDGKKTPLVFESLGPSPMHVECYISHCRKTKLESPISYEYVKAEGYDFLYIDYDPSLFQSTMEAFDEFCEESAEELAHFYRLEQQRNIELQKWL